MDTADIVALLLAGGAFLSAAGRLIRVLFGDKDIPKDFIDKIEDIKSERLREEKNRRARSGHVSISVAVSALVLWGMLGLACGSPTIPDARWVYVDVDSASVVRYDGLVVSEGPGLVYLLEDLPGVLEIENLADSLYTVWVIGACPGLDTLGVR